MTNPHEPMRQNRANGSQWETSPGVPVSAVPPYPNQTGPASVYPVNRPQQPAYPGQGFADENAVKKAGRGGLIDKLATITMLLLIILIAVFNIAMNSSGFGNLDSYRIILLAIYIALVSSWIFNLIPTVSCFLDGQAGGYDVLIALFQALFLFAAATPLVTLWKSVTVDLGYLVMFIQDRFQQIMMVLTFMTGILTLLWKTLRFFFFKED